MNEAGLGWDHMATQDALFMILVDYWDSVSQVDLSAIETNAEYEGIDAQNA